MTRVRRTIARLWRMLRADGGILLGFLALAIIAYAFLKLGSLVTEGKTRAFERALLLAMRNPENPGNGAGPSWLGYLMRDMTSVGGAWILTLVTAVVMGFLIIRRRYWTALFVSASLVGGAMAGLILKAIFARTPPDVVPHIVTFENTSFPSGHAMNSAVVYLTLGALLAQTQPDRPVRAYILVIAILITLGVGCSRLYLGVHWPSDVIAGWGFGAAWAAFCGLIARWLRYRRRIDRPVSGD